MAMAVSAIVGSSVGVGGAMATAAPRPPAPPKYSTIGSRPKLPFGSRLVGRQAAETKVHIDVVLRPRDPQALAAFATAVSTPGNADFRHYISRGQVGPEFGATPATVNAVDSALKAAGLSPGPVSSNDLVIPVEATVAQAASAFHTAIYSYRLSGGRSAYANATAPSLLSSIAPSVEAIFGLDNLTELKPDLVPAPLPTSGRGGVAPSIRNAPSASGPTPCSDAVTTAAGYGAYTANDLAAAYSINGLYSDGYLGSGVTIGLYELEPYDESDISAFQSCYGTSVPISNVAVDGGPGTGAGSGEAALDIEDVISLAPDVSLEVYGAPNTSAGAIDLWNQMLTDDTAQVISTSWGECEAFDSALGGPSVSTENTIFQEMAAQGQSVFAAAGDTGSEACYPNGGSDTVSIGDQPEDVAVDSATGTAYVTNSTDGTVSLYSEAEQTVVATETVGSEPAGVAVDPTTGDVFVANSGDNTVSVFDGATCNATTQSNCTPTTISSAGSEPTGLVADPATGTVYVTDYGGGTVSVISESKMTVVGIVDIGTDSGATAATYDSTTHQLFVANENDDTVSVSSTSSCNATTQSGCAATPVTIDVGGEPDGLGVDTANDTVYVSDAAGATVSVINGSNDSVTTLLTNIPSNPTGVVISPSGSYALIAGSYGSNAKEGPRQDGPNGSKVNRRSQSIASGAGVVAVISTSTNQVTTFLQTGLSPEGVALDSSLGYVYTADNGDNTLGVMPILLNVQDPSSQPYVTGVGGTYLTSDSVPPTETTWNEALNAVEDSPYGAGTGGISENWAMPSYQDGIVSSQSSGTPCKATTGDCREVPDVSASADPVAGYVVYYNGVWTAFGGTSAASPLWAALTGVIESETNPSKRLGELNPTLYKLPRSDFNDITVGNNDYTTTNGGDYPAGSGYDMATGLGSPIGTSLATGLLSQTAGPTLSAVSPSEGPASGNVEVTVTGTGFSTTSGATTIKFGSTAATSVNCTSTTTCTAVEPAGTAGPASVTVTVGGQTSTGVTFTYYTPGLLRVTTSPALASQITVDGNISDTWGLTWVKEPPGSHTVCFAAVQGYITPACQTVTVTAGATTTVTGTFTERGFLHVTTSPAVNSEITYTASGSTTALAMDNYGAWTDIPVGTYSVCFGAVAGYTAPACQTAAITAGATTNITGTFTANSGATGPSGVGLLRVTTSPAVPSQITVDGNIADTWGLNWLQIAPGSHTVCFSSVQGYTTPACQTVTVTAGATTTVTGTFTQRGFLQVETSPAVAGTIYINGTPADDWGVYTDRPAGTYTVCFGAVTGETAPACQTPTVTAATTTTITGTY
jgi:DNA-binding beta-propeller fold protein YncE